VKETTMSYQKYDHESMNTMNHTFSSPSLQHENLSLEKLISDDDFPLEFDTGLTLFVQRSGVTKTQT
jgi:hypothetical protein